MLSDYPRAFLRLEKSKKLWERVLNMVNAQMRAYAQQEETAMERSYREVFLKEGECRFTMEILSADKTIRHYNLHAISKPKAVQEARHLVHLMTEKFDDDRLVWRIPGVTVWSVESAFTATRKEQNTKVTWRQRVNQVIEKYFFIEEEEM